MSIIAIALMVAALALNLATAALNLRQLRRWRRLNHALLETCMMAWHARHTPAPLAAMGEAIELRLRQRR